MSDFTFVHAADLHLDTPFEGIAKPAPEIAAALRDASLDAWDNLVDLTIAEQAAFLLIAGDIYDGARRGVRAQLRFLSGVERLAEHDIAVVAVDGNHDPLGEGWTAIRSWPGNFVHFPAEGLGEFAVIRDGTTIASIRGVSFACRETTENLALRFRGSAAGKDSGLRIGLLHCNAGSSADHDPYSPCSLADLAGAPIDYWALGHIHKRTILRDGAPWVAYPGNLQGRSPKPSETGPKGALVVTVTEGSVIAAPRFVACDCVRFVDLFIDIGALRDLPDLRSQLLALAEESQADNADRGLVLRAHLQGRGLLHADLLQPDVLSILLEELRGELVPAPFVWWDVIRDGTRSNLDREAISLRADLSAELVRSATELAADPPGLAGLLADAFRTLPLQRLPEPLRTIGDEQMLALLASAEELALDLRERD